LRLFFLPDFGVIVVENGRIGVYGNETNQEDEVIW
jgi:hypothetical protein